MTGRRVSSKENVLKVGCYKYKISCSQSISATLLQHRTTLQPSDSIFYFNLLKQVEVMTPKCFL